MKRKTQIFLAIFSTLILSVSVANGQVRYGVKGGMNFSSFSSFEVGYISEAVNSHTGFNAGVAVCVDLPFGLAIQPELLYMEKGMDLEKAVLKTSYLELPVSLQWGLDLIMMRPFIAVTPYVGYALNVSGKNIPGYVLDNKLYNRVEYGVGIGGGIDIWRLQINARYCWNIGNFGDVDFLGVTDKNIAELVSTLNDGNYRGFELSLLFFF